MFVGVPVKGSNMLWFLTLLITGNTGNTMISNYQGNINIKIIPNIEKVYR